MNLGLLISVDWLVRLQVLGIFLSLSSQLCGYGCKAAAPGMWVLVWIPLLLLIRLALSLVTSPATCHGF